LNPVEADPVQLFFGILSSDEERLRQALELIEDKYGPIDYRSESFPFDKTDYYEFEMGSPIGRIFIGMEKLIRPDEIVRIKLESNALEEQLSLDGRRKVNLDPGYLDYDKVVLASAKYNGDKVYLDRGIWADLTLRFKNGKFEPYPWSFPDFKTGLYNNVFVHLRNRYKMRRRILSDSDVT
jgi:hypothetical protein